MGPRLLLFFTKHEHRRAQARGLIETRSRALGFSRPGLCPSCQCLLNARRHRQAPPRSRCIRRRSRAAIFFSAFIRATRPTPPVVLIRIWASTSRFQRKELASIRFRARHPPTFPHSMPRTRWARLPSKAFFMTSSMRQQQHGTKPPHLGLCAPWAQRGRSSLHDHYLSGATQGYGQPYSS